MSLSLWLPLLLGAVGPAVEPCQPSAAALLNSSYCTVHGSQVQLHTQWQLPASAATAPLQLRVAGVLAFPLDGCGNHSTASPVPISVSGLPCPVASPGTYSLDLGVSLPPFVPHGNYRIQIDGSPLLCAAVQVTL